METILHFDGIVSGHQPVQLEQYLICRHGHKHNRGRDGDFFHERYLECECSHVDVVGHRQSGQNLDDVQFLCADCGAVIKVTIFDLGEE